MKLNLGFVQSSFHVLYSLQRHYIRAACRHQLN